MPKQEQVYIGGPMRGHERFNFGAFDSLANWLRRNRKWHVHNPAEHDRECWPDIETWEGFEAGDTERCPKFDLGIALSWDLARVAESQHLVLLPGWEQSTGARHERYVAELTGSSIWLAYVGPKEDPGDWYLRLDMSLQGIGKTPDSLHPTPTPVIPLEHRDPAPVYEAMRAARRVEGEDIEKIERLASQLDTEQINEVLRNATSEQHFGGYVTKDSGKRKAFDSGMVRDTDEGKPRYDLIPIMPLRRLAELYARGAVKYGDCNWQKANSAEEMQRFKASCLRHLYQWLNGEQDEDHAIGAVWNIFAVLWLEDKLS